MPERAGLIRVVFAQGQSAHQCREAQHFVHDPVRLFAGQWGGDVNSGRVRGGASCEALTLLPAEALGHVGQSEEQGFTSETVTSAKSQKSMRKNRLIVHNMRHVSPIIQILFSVKYGYKIQNLRYHAAHD